ncbi:uncharacterized protein LOC124920607 [Impatiens glandulifera]|uniref:uncharacterized protein LOC124920607 n=1 Tax=Impatiens glandulifera TaxID=253017 RepID=UPI001FB0CD83|nr:uncharacterized protein LOC124920607 [Impatiens glandulifera]
METMHHRLPCFSIEVPVPDFSFNQQTSCLFVSKSASFSSFSTRKISISLRKSSIATAVGKGKKKSDSHSFVSRPDEASGFFPEAVLLKEKKVQEDGTILPEFADDDERELFEQLNLELESDLGLKRMRHYEVVYLIHEDHDEEVENVNSKVRDFLKEKQGRLWRFSDWGLRRLAYKIKKAKRAHYILMNFEIDAKWTDEFKSLLDKDERVIRHLVMKKDRAETEDCPPPPEFHAQNFDMYDVDEDEDDDGQEEEEEEDDDDQEEEGEVDIDNESNIIYVEEEQEVDDYMVNKNTKKQPNVSQTRQR